MVNRVVPREQLAEEVDAMANRLCEMSRFGVASAERAINHAEDLMGLRDGIDYAFALHHLSHSYVAEIGESFDPCEGQGQLRPRLMDPADQPGPTGSKLVRGHRPARCCGLRAGSIAGTPRWRRCARREC